MPRWSRADAGGPWLFSQKGQLLLTRGFPPLSSCPFSYPGMGHLDVEYPSGQAVKAFELGSKSSGQGSGDMAGGLWQLTTPSPHFPHVPLC